MEINGPLPANEQPASPSSSSWTSCLHYWKTELHAQLRTSIPATVGMLLYRIPWLISLAFVGRIGTTSELAAAALATTLCNVTGLSLSVGLSSAVTTLTGQARGELLAAVAAAKMEEEDTTMTAAAKMEEVEVELGEKTNLLDAEVDSDAHYSAITGNQHGNDGSAHTMYDQQQPQQPMLLLPLVYLYRGLFIQLAFVLPVGLWWLYPHAMEPFLQSLGQSEDLSHMTATYLRILTPGLWFYSINWTLTSWLQALEMAELPACAAAFGGLLHIPANLFFIRVLGMGWLGVGCATVLYQVVQPLVTFAYLFGTNHGRNRVMAKLLGSHGNGNGNHPYQLPHLHSAWTAISSPSGILRYLQLALPGILAISEWWASEIAIFLAGKLHPHPDIALGAMAVYQSLNSSCFMFPMGMSVAGSARIGKCLGAGDPDGARAASKVCLATAGGSSFIVAGVLMWMPYETFPSLFTTDKDLIAMTARTIPLLSVYVVADGMQVALNALIKGCGRQEILIPIVFISYWIVGVPLSYYLAFVKNEGDSDCNNDHGNDNGSSGGMFCGVAGLVGGITVGTWIHFLLLAGTVGLCIDWDVEARTARRRLGAEKEERGSSKNEEAAGRINR